MEREPEQELAAESVNPSKGKEKLGKQDWLIRVHSEEKITGREGKYIYI